MQLQQKSTTRRALAAAALIVALTACTPATTTDTAAVTGDPVVVPLGAWSGPQQFDPPLHDAQGFGLTTDVDLVELAAVYHAEQVAAANHAAAVARAERAAAARRQAAARAATAPAPAAAPAPVGGNRALGRQLTLARYGSESQWSCLDAIVSRESGWSHTVWNRQGSGAYGIPQALPGHKMSSHGADWRTNPATQIRWMFDYVDGRYGSPCGAWSFWKRNHWY